jgi:hypothetical protein
MQKVHWRTNIPGSPPAVDVVASVVVGLFALCVVIWLDLPSWLCAVAFVVGMFATAAGCSALRARGARPRP